MKNSKLFLSGISMTAMFVLAASCSTKPADSADELIPQDTANAIQTEKLLVKLDTLHTGFDNPWGMTWLSDGKMLVTEKEGEILIFQDDTFTGEKVQGLPEVRTSGQGGLLDVAAHPDYADNGWIYITYSKMVDGDKGATTVLRFQLDGNSAVNQEEIIQSVPGWGGGNHFGSRVVFDNNGHLFYSSGDRFDTPENAQDLTNSHGKVHRIHDDGRIPEDNPFVNEPNAVKSIWTLGNRNPQGLYYDTETNQLFGSEHGPQGGDELNLLEKGKNYGWPVITYGINYDGTEITDITEKEGMEQPLTYYVPSIATAGMTRVTSDRYPEWQGDFLIGALAKMHINRVDMEGGKALSQEVMFQDLGRVRQVAQSPDGYIYAITQGTGLMVKLIPIN